MSKEIRIMSFNIWIEGRSGKQPLSQTAEVIRQSGADIVGMQEVLENTGPIADMLGWNWFHYGRDTAVLSRFPILGGTPHKKGARLQLEDGTEIVLCNVHLAHAPYQPYQLLGIPYGDAPFLKTAEEAVASAEAARAEEVSAILSDAAEFPEGTPIFVTGDFNEPSHLDWTAAAAAAGYHPMAVAYPTSRMLAGDGFGDSFRTLYPDEVKFPGYTWPTVEAAQPTDKEDRLDYVMFRGRGVMPTKFQIVGGNSPYADIPVKPYPSDHRAVMATFKLS